jgi:hypothetical protein
MYPRHPICRRAGQKQSSAELRVGARELTVKKFLLLGGRRRGRSSRFLGRLGLRWLRFQPLQYGSRAASLGDIDRQGNRGDHECHGRPGSCLGERAGSAARSESRLAALSAECRGDVAAFAALQKHDDDNEETDQDVNCKD